MIEIVEVESPEKGVVGVEIDIDGKKYFISKDQAKWSGVRMGKFPVPGFMRPDFRKDVVIYRSEQEDSNEPDKLDREPLRGEGITLSTKGSHATNPFQAHDQEDLAASEEIDDLF